MKPINLIFDATVLTNYFYKNDNRSGIFFAAFNLLKELLKRTDVNVSLYVAPEKYADGSRLKEELSKCEFHTRFFKIWIFEKNICKTGKSIFIYI